MIKGIQSVETIEKHAHGTTKDRVYQKWNKS